MPHIGSTAGTAAPPDADDVFIFPASFAQRRLWLIDQLEPGSSTYNIPIVLRLTGALDVGALRASLTYLVARHEALRTVFDVRDGEPMQVILPPRDVPMDVRHVSESGVRDAVDADANRSFDLANGPVFRATLFGVEQDEHVLLVTLHHIAADGWSLGIILRELSAAYDAFSSGRSPVLAELQVQYADYAVWQREWLDGDALVSQLDYWRGALAAPLPALQLPGDRARTPDTERIAARVPVAVSTSTSDAVRELARDFAVTPFVVLLAAFQLLLARLTGDDDVIVGSPIAGRTRREMEGVVGFFVNTLALRTRFTEGMTVRELIARTRETTLGAFANADVPFERLVEVLQPERDRTRNPIFQALFSVQDLVSADALTMRGLEVRRQQAARETAKFDVQLMLSASKGSFRGTLEYDASLLDAPIATQLAESYAVLLDQMVERPDRRLDELYVLDAPSRQRILTESSGPAVAATGASLCSTFREQVSRTPEVIAISFGRDSISYAQLDARSDSVARGLRARGVDRDVCVGVFMERSLDMLVAVLGILKAGGAYVPLDPKYPAARLQYMIDNARIRTVLVSPGAVPPIDRHDVECLELFDIAMSPGGPLPDSDADALAYVIYTSGSTGTPKGVAMPQAPLVNLLQWQRRESVATVGTRTLQFASLSFDVSFQELFSTWCTGGTLVLVDEDTRRDPEALLRLLKDQCVERIFLPYIALQQLADVAGGHGGAVPSLREIITAGEQLRVTPSIRAWMRAMPECTLANHYGPTESHVVTSFVLSGAVDEWDELPPIGSPIANARVYILDRARQLAAPGTCGEICLGGPVLARGYLGAPEKTAERFVPDPFSDRVGARMYRTGDLGRRRSDGVVEYLGRMDGQVKLRGYRVEPGEVEAVIARDPAVAECAAVVREDVPGERRLVAYVVARGDTVDIGALRDLCRAQLPEFMIPSAFVSLASLPLTPSGKVDRRSLPIPDDSGTVSAAFEPPIGDVESTVAAIWAEVLHVDRIGRRDDFFERGGHSLLATRVVSRVRDRLRSEVPLRALFDHPVLAEFAEEVERKSSADVRPRAGDAIIGRAAFRGRAQGGGSA